MLMEFSLSNFKSFKDKVRFSLIASSSNETKEDKLLKDSNIVNLETIEGHKKISLLRSAVIYGPNGAGKSNLLKGLAVMKELITSSRAPDEKLTLISPYLFDEEDIEKPTFFEVIILIDKIRYQYGFLATINRVFEEWLYAFPKGSAQHWFSRKFDEKSEEYIYKFSAFFSGNKKGWASSTHSTSLFLSIAVQQNAIQLTPVYRWFEKTLIVVNNPDSLQYSYVKWLKKGKKQEILDFLTQADFSIKDLRFEEKPINPGLIEKITKLFVVHKTKSGKLVALDLKDESDGTRKILDLASSWLTSLQEEHVLCIDELHDNFHPYLVKFLVMFFHKKNLKKSQLIFTTHETSIFSPEVFRRDQIWFCEKNEQKFTDLYSLADFHSDKNIKDLEHAYMKGMFGALPFLPKIIE